MSNRIVKEMKNYKDINLRCNTQDERFGLAEKLNSEKSKKFQSMFDGEMKIDDLLVSGQFTKV